MQIYCYIIGFILSKFKTVGYVVRAIVLVIIIGFTPIMATKILKTDSGYLALTELQQLHREITIHYDPLTLVAEIKFQKRTVRFKPGEKFYTSGSYVVALEKPARLKDGIIWLPHELVEEIITELNLPVRYNFSREKLKIAPQGDSGQNKKDALSASRFPDIIVLDAGHGGRDPGAFGALESVEKEITLETTRRLARHLKSHYPSTKVVLVRSKDKFISLEERSAIANQYFSNDKNSIFISIHCNATLSPKVRGFEVYYLAVNPANMSARETELRENRMEGSRHLRALASRLINAGIQYESKTLARAIEKSMHVSLQGLVESRGVRKADFAVLRGTLMPSVLVELGYITNRQEVQVLRSENFHERFNQAITQAIAEYARHLP